MKLDLRKKSFIVCLCFKCSAVHKENDTQTFEKEAWNYQAVQKTQTELVIRLSVSIEAEVLGYPQ